MADKKKNYFLDPVGALPERAQLISAIVILLLSVFVSYQWGVAHDGIYHATFISKQPVLFLLLTNIIVALLPALLLLLAGIFFNRGTRLRDMCTTVLFSRLPLTISYAIFFAITDPGFLTGVQHGPQSAVKNLSSGNETTLILPALITLPLVIYSFILLINGARTSMNAKRPVHYILIIAAVITSEILYRLLIYPNLLKL